MCFGHLPPSQPVGNEPIELMPPITASWSLRSRATCSSRLTCSRYDASVAVR